ncbi:unnamed protein product [Rhizoctonia solani]|uniref:C2H2-type domain-containing protein n=1 Tax=Rhizoctonia solani TaxID=456999 RepID=A0A8H3D9G9_9AGAM|nr:unnamed protein product [Rhizoctonia solani]
MSLLYTHYHPLESISLFNIFDNTGSYCSIETNSSEPFSPVASHLTTIPMFLATEPAEASANAELLITTTSESTSPIAAGVNHATRPKERAKKSLARLKGCPLCGKLFDIKQSNWERHMDTHADRKRFQCSYQSCSERKRTKDQVIIHFITHHIGMKLGKGIRPSPEQRALAETFVIELNLKDGAALSGLELLPIST